MRRPLAVLAIVGVAATIGVAAGCGDDDSDDSAADTTEVVGDVAAGKTVFIASCTTCHASQDAEGTEVGPDLSDIGSGHTPEQLRSAIVDGRGDGAMPAGLVSGADLDNVVAYLESQQ